MTQTYKVDRAGNILNEKDEIVLTIVAGNCSTKYRQRAAKLLANALFTTERGEKSAFWG